MPTIALHPDPMPGEPAPALQEYPRRLRLREEQLAGIRLRHQHLWSVLVLVAGAACLVAFQALVSHTVPFLWIILPALAGAAIFGKLTQNSRAYDRMDRVVRFYQSGVARLHSQWRGQGTSGEEFQEQEQRHLYAADLDVFGTGSLFELLCTARTGIGRATLAGWLLQPAQEEEIIARQQAARELQDKVDLREDWASSGDGGLEDVDSHALRAWANAPPERFPVFSRIVVMVLPLCLIAILIMGAAGVMSINEQWFRMLAVVLVAEGILAGLYLEQSRKIAADIVLPVFELSLLGPLFERLESGHFQSARLQSIQSRLTHGVSRPSQQIRTLARLARIMELRQNDLATFLAPLLAGTHLAMRIEDWRRRKQKDLVCWLDALGEFEALLCLARHHYENPDYVFPALQPQSAGTAILRAELLGHPLIDEATRVTCDLTLDSLSQQLLIVSGSNMSGKSTLLRSVGLNAVLALAGGPVCAKQMALSNLRIACSIAVHDSLRDNKSRFQAEVERLKAVLDTARATGTLFLLDEMLSGTNSKDRLFGAQAVISELLTAAAIGLITTHDLALTQIGDSHNGRVSNVHFEEYYADGAMQFDYRMRPGVLTRTNGINVMAALGLLREPK